MAPSSTRRIEINHYLFVTSNQSQDLGTEATLLFAIQKLSCWTEKLKQIFWVDIYFFFIVYARVSKHALLVRLKQNLRRSKI